MSEVEIAPGREPPVHGIPAATVVIYRHDPAGGPAQLLMVERSEAMRFAGGAAVFPGGRIDPADRVLADALASGLDPDDAAGRVAAVRETLEETGLVVGIDGAVDAAIAAAARAHLLECGELAPVLEANGWRLRFDALVPFARWWPRHLTGRVFDTRFYLADLGTGAVELEVDQTENRHLFWTSARGALDLADQGKIKIIFPTRRNLERLALFDTYSACAAHAAEVPMQTITPWMEQRDGRPWLTIPADAGYPQDGEWLDSAERAL